MNRIFLFCVSHLHLCSAATFYTSPDWKNDFDDGCSLPFVISLATNHSTTVIVYEESYRDAATMFTTLMESYKRIVLYDYLAFPEFLGEYMERLLQHAILEQFRSHLNFLVICGRTCIQTVFNTVSAMDSSTGRDSLLRHFSTWLIISPESPQWWNITLDNVALIQTGLPKPTQMLSDLNRKLKICLDDEEKENINSSDLFTLLWMPGGREWSRVNFSGDQLYTSIYPNTLRGLNGRKIILSTLEWLPFVKRRVSSGKVTYVGAGMDIVEILMNRFNFSYLVVEPQDGEWGHELDNGSWTGVIGMLDTQTADMCPVLYAISQQRKKVVDFSFPVEATTYAAIYRKDAGQVSSWFFLLTCFSWQVYLCGLAPLLWMVFLLEYIRKHMQNEHESVSGSVGIVISTCLRQGEMKPAKDSSTNIAVFTWGIFCLVMTAVYTGNLVAFATVDKYKPPFTTLQELAEDDSYGIGAYEGTYIKDVIMTSNCSICRALYSKLYKSTSDGKYPSQDILRRKLMEEKFVLLVSKEVEETIMSTSFDYIAMKERFLPVHSAFIFRRHSPLKLLFDKQLAALKESSIYDRVMLKWVSKRLECYSTDSNPQLKFDNLKTATVVCAVCVLVATVVLLVERSCLKRAGV